MRNLTSLLLVGGAAAILAACGGDSGAECGTGTVEVDGTCVPSDQACGDGTAFNTATGQCDAVCATGTVLMGNECVPDGSVICETGTTYNSSTGKCDADITGCADGTVLVSGECVPYDDTLVGDVNEGAEPNGDEYGATPTIVDMPAVGSDVVIKGRVETRPDADLDDNGDGDLDFYVLQATGPTLLDLTIDGVGGMSGGFAVITIDPALSATGWFRFGINLVGDTTERQVFLPKAGTYVLAIADSRTLSAGLAYGDGTNTCYFATVANVALPTPTAIAGPLTAGTISTDAQFYSYTPAEGDTLDTTLTIDSFSSNSASAVTTLVDDAFVSWVETASPAEDTIAGLTAANNVVFVVEESYAIQQSVAYDFTFAVSALAADGMVPADGTVSVAPGADASRYYFDAAVNDVVLIELDGSSTSTDFNVNIEGPGLDGEVALFAGQQTGSTWVSLPSGGRYYLNVTNFDGNATTAVMPTFTRTHVQAQPLTYGTPVTDVALANDGNAFYYADLSSAFWMSVSFSSTGFGGNASASGYTGAGPLSGGFNLVDGLEVLVGADPQGGPGTVLIHVMDDNFSAASTPTFSFGASEAQWDNKMTPTEATPVSDTGVSIPADTALAYGLNVSEDAEVTISVTGTSGTDVVLHLLDENGQPVQTIDANPGDGAETYTVTNPALGARFFPFSVATSGGAAGTFDLSITVVDPPYNRTVSKVDMTDLCDNGTVVDLTDGLSAAIDIGFDFPFFGVDKTQFMVTGEGAVILDGAYAGTASLGEAADGSHPVIVPNMFGLDTDSQVCMTKTATAVSLQWRGAPFGLTSQLQIVLRNTGRIDMRFGPGEEFVQFLDAQIGFNAYPAMLMDGTGVTSLYRGLRDTNVQVKFEP